MSELSSYFASGEIEAAGHHIEEFHGRFLLSDKLGRVDAVLLALYMFCNHKKASSAPPDELREFALQKLAMNARSFSKGLYDVKQAGNVSDRNNELNLTFQGLKRIRELLTASNRRTENSRE